ncbi:hypothetical protein ACMX2H_07495 [Arthrobacter sulfonylureivorans]|uniref:DUF7793 family protein n=1 Tax=Arthrobacter sulfonylureivorans TaxID=2486855 RepID=UPI0039E51857
MLEEVHSTFDVQLDDDGLMVLTLHRGLSVGAELAQQVVDHLFDLVGDRRVVMLLRIAGVRWATSEVQAVAQTFTPSIALAVLGDGPVDRVLANFFLRIFDDEDFARYFDDEAEARAWLAPHVQRLPALEVDASVV